MVAFRPTGVPFEASKGFFITPQESKSCLGCIYSKDTCTKPPKVGACLGLYREDGRQVIFVPSSVNQVAEEKKESLKILVDILLCEVNASRRKREQIALYAVGCVVLEDNFNCVYMHTLAKYVSGSSRSSEVMFFTDTAVRQAYYLKYLGDCASFKREIASCGGNAVEIDRFTVMFNYKRCKAENSLLAREA